MSISKYLVTLGVCSSATLFAQMIPAPPPNIAIAGFPMAGPGPMLVEGFAGKLVKGAPYTAVAVTESTQTLADGNRIQRSSSSVLARDSMGRTRREQSLSSVGPWAAGKQAHSMVFINDPVAEANYVLDPEHHTAHKMPGSPGPDREKWAAEAKTLKRVQVTGAVASKAEAEDKALGRERKVESLGSKAIEGVMAEGTRITLTWPAGALGNEKPLVYVTEMWYSQELQMNVMTHYTDPMTGETTYSLTNIQRAEPDASLFQVPADYTVQEGKEGIVKTLTLENR